MPLRDLADLERRIRRLEMGADQSRHKLVVPERTVSVAPPLGAGDVPYVDLTTDQIIEGVKTFGDIPLLPASDPTSDNQAARKAYVDSRVVFLTTPLTSTDWDGDSYSTVGKTKIELSTVFGTPINIKAVLMWYGIRDSASATFDANLELSPNAVLPAGMSVGCSGLVDNKWMRGLNIVPCDEDGNIYYRITASGTNTMQIYLQIWGYWL